MVSCGRASQTPQNRLCGAGGAVDGERRGRRVTAGVGTGETDRDRRGWRDRGVVGLVGHGDLLTRLGVAGVPQTGDLAAARAAATAPARRATRPTAPRTAAPAWPTDPGRRGRRRDTGMWWSKCRIRASFGQAGLAGTPAERDASRGRPARQCRRWSPAPEQRR